MSRGRRSLLGLVTLGLLSAALLINAPAWAASVGSSATIVLPGQVVQVSGSEYAPDDSVRLCWDNENCANLGQTTPGEDGSFTVPVTIPGDATLGLHTITACQGAGADLCASVTVTVLPLETTTTIATTTTSTAPPTTTTSTTQPTTTTTQGVSPTPPRTVPTTTTTTTSAGSTTPTTRPTTTTVIANPITPSPPTTLPPRKGTGHGPITTAPPNDLSEPDSFVARGVPSYTVTTTTQPALDNDTDTETTTTIETEDVTEPDAEVLGLSIESEESAEASESIVDTVNMPLAIFFLATAALLILAAIALVMREFRR